VGGDSFTSTTIENFLPDISMTVAGKFRGWRHKNGFDFAEIKGNLMKHCAGSLLWRHLLGCAKE
jgi:hypothetical protein